MFKTIRKTITFAALTVAMLSLSSCNGDLQSILKDANLQLSEVGGEQTVSMMTEINTSNLVISAGTISIAKGLGTVEIVSDVTTGKTYLKLTFKLSKALNLPSFNYATKLPNGLTMPLSGVDLNKMMAFDIGSSGSKVYLYYDATTKKSILGLALNIAALNIGTPASVLSSFNFNNVSGVAGLYFGDKTNMSGIAIFANLSGIFSTVLAENNFEVMASQPLRFHEVKTSREKQQLIENKLQDLNSKKARVIVK